MKKVVLLISLAVFLVLNSNALIASDFGDRGPAPNSGDGVSDGSGFDSVNGPNGTGPEESGNGPAGPAPNSGDGVPDGSGFDSNNEPNGTGSGPDSNGVTTF